MWRVGCRPAALSAKRLFASAGQDAAASGRRAWATVWPVLLPLLGMGSALSMWPFFDLWVLPWACRRAIESRPTGASEEDKAILEVAQDVCSRLLTQEASDIPRQVLVLVGPEAPRIGRGMVQLAERPCGRIDLSTHTVMNPYELLAFRHLGTVGDLLNVYVKAAIFVSSILSQRHPFIDATLYIHNAMNNFRRALQNLHEDGRRPLLLIENLDSLHHHFEASCSAEAKTLTNHLAIVVSQQSLSFVEEGLADVVWVLRDKTVLSQPGIFQELNRRAKLVEIITSRGRLLLK